MTINMKGLSKVFKKLSNYSNHYSDSKFWKKIKSIPAKAGSKAIYYSLVLFYLLKSGDVNLKQKALICGALGYLIFPPDLIPDVLVPLGYTDDVAVLLYAISLVQSEITPEIENKAKQKLSDLGFHDDRVKVSIA